MNLTLTLLGIGINLVGIGLQVSPLHNIWLTLVCVFFGGGFVFLGLFGKRQVLDGKALLDRLDPAMFNTLAFMLVIMTVFFLANIGTAAYKIIEREMDIQAAKAGISTPSATASPKANH